MINPEYFKVKIEQFNPYSQDYKDFWRFIRRGMIEGYWVSGYYMPPQLFYYINLHHIKLNKKKADGTFANNKTVGKPFLQDTDWIRGRIFFEARGFSGFSNDIKYHCISETKKKFGVTIPEDKTYVHPREYLKLNHGTNLGKPLYQNQAYNVFDLEPREGGKSMIASAFIAHNYLTDGITDYDEYLEDSKSGIIYTSESVISSVDQKYSNDLAAKVRLALDNLEGDQTINGNYFPCPLKKVESGSLAKTLKASKEIQIKGVRQTVGSGSLIHNITFGSDEFAGAGKRPSVAIVDEVGFAFLLKEILSNMKDATYSSSDKFGTIWMTGTGGEMDASAINNIKEVFYNPEAFDCLVFNDEWENKGKCGLFFPKWETLRDFKDENGNTKLEESKSHWEKQYQKALDSKDSIVINKFLINSPGCPSHAFLTKDGNKFPADLIEKQIARVKSTKELLNKGIKGDIFLENGFPIFKNETQLGKNLYEVPFPYNRDKDSGYGCVTIYEFPKQNNQEFVYISAMDPVAHEVGDSLPSTFIYKRSSLDDLNGDILVAEITGRFDKFKDHLEKSRLLLIMYNATCLYENSHNHFKEHMDNKFSLKYLAYTPNTFSATVTKVRKYGLPMNSVDLRLELEQYAYDWMLEPNPAGGINLDYIYSLNLLEELKIYDGNKTNTDRADAFIILIGYKISLTKKVIKEKQESDFYKFMARKQRVEKD